MNLRKVFEFIMEKRGYNLPFKYRLIAGLPIIKDELYFKGNLDLDNTDIKKLPDNLTVIGRLNLQNTKITELPNNLTVKGYLDIENTDINTIPNNLKIGGDLYLFRTPISSPISSIISSSEVRKMIEDKGGEVRGKIYFSFFY